MTQAIAKYAAKKMLEGEMEKYKSKRVTDQYDPYYEEIVVQRKPGKSPKTKKVKKQIPAYIPSHDADILARARKSAYRLDCCLFSFMGTRFGWSSVIGLIPAIGDFADFALAINLCLRISKVEGGLPMSAKVKMAINILVDFLVGLIPFVGDLADAAIRCNSRNVRLLEEHLDRKYKPKKDREAEEKMPKEKRPRPATIYEDFFDEQDNRRDTSNDRHDDVHQPQRAYFAKRERVSDEEMGVGRRDTHKSHRSQHDSGHRNHKHGRR